MLLDTMETLIGHAVQSSDGVRKTQTSVSSAFERKVLCKALFLKRVKENHRRIAELEETSGRSGRVSSFIFQATHCTHTHTHMSEMGTQFTDLWSMEG